LGGRLKKKLCTAAHLLRHDPRQLVRDLVGRLEWSVVYAADPRKIAPPEENSRLTFARFPEESMASLAERTDEVGEYARRFHDKGFNDAYAVYCDGKLANITWMITVDHDRTLPMRYVKLRDGEAELTHGITLPEFRGQGIAPYSYRRLCLQATQMGIRRVYGMINIDNIASQRAVEKIGFRRQGHMFRLVFHYLPGEPFIIFRGHRWGLRSWLRRYKDERR
jgi:RimJ/RimL family protein N-acetyltransferase